MATDCMPQVTFEFQGLRQPVVARFDQTHASSDGGAVLLKAVDERLGLRQRLAASLTDGRQPCKVQHELIELVEQRVYGIACGRQRGQGQGDEAEADPQPIESLRARAGTPTATTPRAWRGPPLGHRKGALC